MAFQEAKNHHIVHEMRAQWAPRFMKLDLFTLFWLFMIGSLVGLVLESLFHVIVYGSYESRAGFVWGPLSPIYGVGACLLTIVVNRFYYTHNIILFLAALVLGSCIEFGASLMMEYFWGAIAWDYTGTFGSIGGRTNFAFGVMWGMLGLFWARVILPAIKWAVDHTNRRSIVIRIITWILVVFLVVDSLATILAFNRENERKSGVEPTTQIDYALDALFPNEWMEHRFHNMTILGNGEIDHSNALGNTNNDPIDKLTAKTA